MKKALSMALIVALLLGMALPAAAAKNAAGMTLRLENYEGEVEVLDAAGRAVSVRNDMRLYNGYTVSTAKASYAYISLDDSKAVKLDALSKTEVRKKGRKLELFISSGNVFFDVSKPLESDESLNIRTATMITGVRGTAGWVEVRGGRGVSVALLDGSLGITSFDPSSLKVWQNTITAGQTLTGDFSNSAAGGPAAPVVTGLTADSVPGFVGVEVAGNADLQERVRQTETLDVEELILNSGDRLSREQLDMQGRLEALNTELDKLPKGAERKPAQSPKPSAKPLPQYIPTPSYEPYNPQKNTAYALEVSGTPVRTAYVYGQSFNKAGLTVTLRYANGYTEIVTPHVKADALKAGDTSATLRYAGLSCKVEGINVAKADIHVNVTPKADALVKDSSDFAAAAAMLNAHRPHWLAGTLSVTALRPDQYECDWRFEPLEGNYNAATGTCNMPWEVTFAGSTAAQLNDKLNEQYAKVVLLKEDKNIPDTSVEVPSGKTLILSNGSINMGNNSLTNKGELVLEGGTLHNTKDSECRPVVINSGKMTMSGTAEISSSGSFALTDSCSIVQMQQDTSSPSSAPTLVMSGGKITANSSTSFTGLAINDGCTATIEGDAKIEGPTGVKLATGGSLTIDTTYTPNVSGYIKNTRNEAGYYCIDNGASPGSMAFTVKRCYLEKTDSAGFVSDTNKVTYMSGGSPAIDGNVLQYPPLP